MPLIVPEIPGAEPAIEALLDHAFGPQRHAKTAQRLRDGSAPAHGLAFLAMEDDIPVGTLRFWPIRLGEQTAALLLGPIAVDRRLQGRGLGSEMIRHGLRRARQFGHASVLLVGDEPYYRRFGFSAALTCRLALPGPVDRRRFLGLELASGALADARGMVTAARSNATSPLRRRAA